MKKKLISKVDYSSQFEKLASYSEEDLNGLSFQISFDFDCVKPVYYHSCFKTLYRKSDGTVYEKVTKNRPYSSQQLDRMKPGYVNSYGHQCLQIYQQYKLF